MSQIQQQYPPELSRIDAQCSKDQTLFVECRMCHLAAGLKNGCRIAGTEQKAADRALFRTHLEKTEMGLYTFKLIEDGEMIEDDIGVNLPTDEILRVRL